MTNTLASQIADLAKQTRSYLLNQFEIEDSILAVPEAHSYFGSKPVIPNHEPNKTYRPVIPGIQKPVPPPVRKPFVPPAPIEQPPKKSVGSFSLEPLSEAPICDLSNIRATYAQRFPHTPVLEPPELTRLENKEITTENYPQVALLVFSSNPKQLELINNLARAIQLRWNLRAEVLPAQHWEKENAWDQLLAHKNLRLVLASDYGLQNLPRLMKNYREVSKQGHHYLGQKPLLLLSDLSIYLREPHLKLSLWQAITVQLNQT